MRDLSTSFSINMISCPFSGEEGAKSNFGAMVTFAIAEGEIAILRCDGSDLLIIMSHKLGSSISEYFRLGTDGGVSLNRRFILVTSGDLVTMDGGASTLRRGSCNRVEAVRRDTSTASSCLRCQNIISHWSMQLGVRSDTFRGRPDSGQVSQPRCLIHFMIFFRSKLSPYVLVTGSFMIFLVRLHLNLSWTVLLLQDETSCSCRSWSNRVIIDETWVGAR